MLSGVPIHIWGKGRPQICGSRICTD